MTERRDIRFYLVLVFSGISSAFVCVLCLCALFSTVNNETKTNKRLENCSVNGNTESYARIVINIYTAVQKC